MKIKIYLFVLFVFGILYSGSAKASLEDLVNQLQVAKEDTSKVWLLHDLGFKYSIKDLDSSFFYVQNALELSEKLNYTKGIISSLHRLSYFYKMTGDPESEEKLAIRAIQTAIQHKQLNYLGKGYKHLGDIARDKINLDSAFYYYSLAIENYEKHDEIYNSFIVYLDLHRVFLQRGQKDQAEAQLLKAYEITKPKAIRRDYGMVLYFLVKYYFQSEEWDNYATYSERYLRFLQGSDPAFSEDIYHKSLFYFDNDFPEIKKAEVIEQVIEKHRTFNNSYSLISAFLELHRLKKAAGDLQGSINALREGLKVAEEMPSMTSIAGFSKLLADEYEQSQQLAAAYPHLKRANLINDSLNTVAIQKNMDELNVRFETAKKEEAIARQDLAIEKQTLQNRNAWIVAIAAGIIALIAGWFLYFKSKTNRLLEKQKSQIEKSLTEKEVLLREIHHRVKNNLQVISSLLNWQSRYIEDSQAKSAIREGRNRVKSMALIHQDLYQKENLTAVNVADYIEKLSVNLFDSYNITPENIEFKSEVDPIDLDVDVLIPLGLILNELISNALKHAFPENRPGTVSVQLIKDANQLLLNVSDDGIGIPQKSSKPKKDSFGYQLIETFVAKLKATMKIENISGTQVQLTIPIGK